MASVDPADVLWPQFDPAEPQIVLVVQVSGKLRERLEVDAGLPEGDA